MEKLVRVISQGAPQTRQWTNPNTGELKNITSVEVEMTDGLDRFIAEASDDLAVQLANSPLNTDLIYQVRCDLRVSQWTTQQGTLARATRIRISKIMPV